MFSHDHTIIHLCCDLGVLYACILSSTLLHKGHVITNRGTLELTTILCTVIGDSDNTPDAKFLWYVCAKKFHLLFHVTSLLTVLNIVTEFCTQYSYPLCELLRYSILLNRQINVSEIF